MKINCKSFLVLFLLLFFIGCNDTKETIEDVYDKENLFTYSMRIVNSERRMYFIIEQNKSHVSILNYINDKLLDEIDIELSFSEINSITNFINKQTDINSAINKQYKFDIRYSMTFISYYGGDNLEATFKGMKVADLPIEIKKIILKMNKKNKSVKDFFDYER